MAPIVCGEVVFLENKRAKIDINYHLITWSTDANVEQY